jgi:hypothetical protein
VRTESNAAGRSRFRQVRSGIVRARGDLLVTQCWDKTNVGVGESDSEPSYHTTPLLRCQWREL